MNECSFTTVTLNELNIWIDRDDSPLKHSDTLAASNWLLWETRTITNFLNTTGARFYSYTTVGGEYHLI